MLPRVALPAPRLSGHRHHLFQCAAVMTPGHSRLVRRTRCTRASPLWTRCCWGPRCSLPPSSPLVPRRTPSNTEASSARTSARPRSWDLEGAALFDGTTQRCLTGRLRPIPAPAPSRVRASRTAGLADVPRATVMPSKAGREVRGDGLRAAPLTSMAASLPATPLHVHEHGSLELGLTLTLGRQSRHGEHHVSLPCLTIGAQWAAQSVRGSRYGMNEHFLDDSISVGFCSRERKTECVGAVCRERTRLLQMEHR